MFRVSRNLLALASCLLAFVAWSQSAPDARAGRIGYVSFKVRDLERSQRFYENVLGLKEARRLQPGNGVVELLLDGPQPGSDSGVMLIYEPRRDTPYDHGDGYSRMVVYVADLTRVSGALEGTGGTVLRKPTRIERLKISVMLVRDPDEYLIEFVQRDE